MIRWKAVIPVTIIIVAVTVICIFFLDAIVKSIMISTGQSIVGAKVEIKKVNISLKNSSLTIKGLAVANADDPWKNLLEAEKISFDVQTLPIFSKKIIIDEITAEGLTWGTQRKTSGVLPKKRVQGPVSRDQKKEEKTSGFDTQQLVDKLKALGGSVDVKKLIDVDNLEAVKKAHGIQQDVQTKKEEWNNRVLAFDGYKEKLDTMKTDLEAVKSVQVKNIQDIAAAKEQLKKLQDAQNQLKTMQKEVADAKDNILSEVNLVKKNIAGLDSLKDLDYKKIISSLGFGDISKSSLGNALFGPLIMGRVNTALTWINTVKSKIPKSTQKKKQKRQEVTRLKGKDIIFPIKKILPTFWSKKLSFSAHTAPDTASPLVLSGTITDITSNPALIGKPIQVNAAGQFSSMKNSHISLKGIMDYTTDISQETFDVAVQGYDVGGLSWGAGSFMPSGISRGTGSITLIGKRLEETISCTLNSQISHVRFTPVVTDTKDSKDKKLQSIMNDIFSSIDELSLTGTIKGKPPKDINMALQSNLDDIFTKKIKELFAKELDSQKARIKQELDTIVNTKKKELLGDVQSKQKELEEKLLGSQGLVQGKMDFVKNLIKDKESEIKNITDQKKEEGQEKVKDQINQQFKKLFK